MPEARLIDMDVVVPARGWERLPASITDEPRLAIVLIDDVLDVVRLGVDTECTPEPLPHGTAFVERLHPASLWAQVRDFRLARPPIMILWLRSLHVHVRHDFAQVVHLC